MVRYIIASTIKFLVVILTAFYSIFYDGIYEKNYKHINQTIVDGNVMNMYSVIMEGKYDTIDADNYLCHNYYIIKFALSPYTSTILVATGPQYPTVNFIQNF